MAEEETATPSSTRISLDESKGMFIRVPDRTAGVIMEIHRTTGIKLSLLKETVARIVFSVPPNRTRILALLIGSEPIQMEIPGTSTLAKIEEELAQPAQLEIVEPPQTVTPVIKPPTMKLGKELGLEKGSRANRQSS